MSGMTWLQVTLHQGAIESIFLDSLHDLGIEVSRPVVPCSIKLSTDKIILADPEAYPIRVCSALSSTRTFVFSPLHL